MTKAELLKKISPYLHKRRFSNTYRWLEYGECFDAAMDEVEKSDIPAAKAVWYFMANNDWKVSKIIESI